MVTLTYLIGVMDYETDALYSECIFHHPFLSSSL